MCSLTGEEDSPVPPRQFRHLRDKLHPPGRVRIWVTYYSPEPGETEFRIAWFDTHKLSLSGPTSGDAFTGYAITVNVGHFAFQVFGHESRQTLHVEPPTIYGLTPPSYEIQIWPTRPAPISWPASHGFGSSTIAQYAERLSHGRMQRFQWMS